MVDEAAKVIQKTREADRGAETSPPARGLKAERLPSKETLRAALEVAADAVCLVDCSSGRILSANASAEKLFGYGENEWKPLGLDDLVSGSEIGRFDPHEDFAAACLRDRSGCEIPAQWRLFRSEKEGTGIAIFRPIASAEPVSASERDPLTGLPSRAVAERRLKGLLGRRPSKLALMFLDLDGFKEVNDRHGHPVGDCVLRELAERLKACLRPDDTIARYGGDEFLVLMEGVERESAATSAAQRLLEVVARPFTAAGHRVEITASIGIVLGQLAGEDAEGAIGAADRAMYRAKRLGSGRYYVFQAAGDSREESD